MDDYKAWMGGKMIYVGLLIMAIGTIVLLDAFFGLPRWRFK
jgi:uncharacterized membrane protein